MKPLTTLEGITKGDYLIKEISYQSPEGIVISLHPVLVEKVRKNFIDVKDEYLNIGGSIRKTTFKIHSTNLGKTVKWYSI